MEPVSMLPTNPEKEKIHKVATSKEMIDQEIGDVKDSVDLQKTEELDLFVPFQVVPGTEEKATILTIRAVLVGSMLGCLVTASNTYLGLKTAFSFGAGLFGSLLGFAILKAVSKAVPENFPILGGYFGPRENSIVQTSAVTSGGLSFIFISGIPALYQLGLLGSSPQHDYWKLVTFAAVSAYYGLIFAAPMRNFFLKTVGREMQLTFPTSTANALMIRSLHAGGTGTGDSKKKVKVLLIAFASALILRVVSQYAVGILWDWHIFTWFFIWGKYHNAALAIESWGWFIEWTPAFIGSGMLVGPNVALSYFGGAFLSYAIIGPALVHQGLAFGISPYAGTKWASYTIYSSLSLTDPVNKPSPRYWLLWPGVMVMLCASVAELLVQYKVIWKGGKRAVQETKHIFAKKNSTTTTTDKKSAFYTGFGTGAVEMIRWWMWAPETIVVAILTCVVLSLQYSMDVATSVVSLVFGVILSMLSIQVAGVVDQIPTSAITKCVQLVLGGVTKGHYTMISAQRINITGAQVAGGASYAATELMQDFRVGFLLDTPLVQQFLAQIIGNIFAIFLSPAMFILFAKAYPCIIDTTITQCAFAVPAASAWKSIAVAVTNPVLPIPLSSGVTAIVLGVFTILLVAFRHFVLVDSRAKYKIYVPNMSVIGLSMIIPSTCYNTAITMGALIAYMWHKKYPRSANIYVYVLAAGLIAGEGIGGVVNAIFQIADISGSVYGSNIACPLDSC